MTAPIDVDELVTRDYIRFEEPHGYVISVLTAYFGKGKVASQRLTTLREQMRFGGLSPYGSGGTLSTSLSDTGEPSV